MTTYKPHLMNEKPKKDLNTQHPVYYWHHSPWPSQCWVSWIWSNKHSAGLLCLCYCVTMAMYHCITMSLCHYVIMSLCHCVTMSLCHYVTMSLCHYVTISLCHYVTMSLCHYVTMSLSLDFTLKNHTGQKVQRVWKVLKKAPCVLLSVKGTATKCYDWFRMDHGLDH